MRFLAGIISFLAALMSAILDCGQTMKIDEWDHGFKSEYVTATRYANHHGFNVGFRFPKHPLSCDSPELFEWFTKYDGVVFQGGGAPGAELLVVFKDVTDKESANQKLAVVMPALTEFMRERN